MDDGIHLGPQRERVNFEPDTQLVRCMTRCARSLTIPIYYYSVCYPQLTPITSPILFDIR